MTHNPKNRECPLYNFNLNGLDVSWHPDCTCSKEEPVDGKKVNKDYLRGYEQGKFDAEMDRLNMKEPVEGWEERFRHDMSLKVRATNHADGLKAFLLQKQTNLWWDETFLDPTVDFFREEISKALQQERQRILREIPTSIAHGNYNCGEEGCCNPNPSDHREKECIEYQAGFNTALAEVRAIISNRKEV